jgi:acetylornithine deacetylase
MCAVIDPTRALARLDADRLTEDVARLVRVPSVTGGERPVMEAFLELCREHGLPASLHEHDLAALRSRPGYPGEEALRDELVGVTATLAGGDGPRLCFNGHLDVVGPGTEPWTHGPWSGAVVDGLVFGRGALDMKAGVVAALHAMAAVGEDAPGEVVLQAVASEEDGGLGTFAALEADSAFDACVIPEPTGLAVVAAHGGALTFRGVVRGVSAHAAMRLEGVSAIDRYVPLHLALADLERELNAEVAHPLMAALELPYPVNVGQVHAGDWSSSVPDRLEFECRVGVPVGVKPAAVRERVEALVGGVAELSWTGGQFSPAATDLGDPLVALVSRAAEAETGAPARLMGMPAGTDMRQFTARGIPCLLFGAGDLRLAHAVDEHVPAAELLALARALVRVIAG